jgi:hypothetical protein
MPLCFWATQTAVAAADLHTGAGCSHFTPYLPPHTAATTIQHVYRSYLRSKPYRLQVAGSTAAIVVTTTDAPATTGALAEGTVAAATGTNTTASPPDALLSAMTATITAAVMATFKANIGTALKVALKHQLSPMQAEMASNHGQR